MFSKSYNAKLIARNQIDAIGTTYDLWRFNSEKSGKEYMILMEKYHGNVYGVKFHLRSLKKDKMKFSKMTHDGEANVVIRTVIDVMLHYISEDQDSSFVIIGASGEGEETANNKRYLLYKKIICIFVTDEHFYHYDLPERGMYMLLRKTEVDCGNISGDGCVRFIDDILLEHN